MDVIVILSEKTSCRTPVETLVWWSRSKDLKNYKTAPTTLRLPGTCAANRSTAVLCTVGEFVSSLPLVTGAERPDTSTTRIYRHQDVRI